MIPDPDYEALGYFLLLVNLIVSFFGAILLLFSVLGG